MGRSDSPFDSGGFGDNNHAETFETGAFFESEVIPGTINPTWTAINTSIASQSQRLNRFHIKIWHMDFESHSGVLLFEENILLRKLHFVGENLTNLCALPLNSLIFVLHDGCYATEDVAAQCIDNAAENSSSSSNNSSNGSNNRTRSEAKRQLFSLLLVEQLISEKQTLLQLSQQLRDSKVRLENLMVGWKQKNIKRYQHSRINKRIQHLQCELLDQHQQKANLVARRDLLLQQLKNKERHVEQTKLNIETIRMSHDLGEQQLQTLDHQLRIDYARMKYRQIVLVQDLKSIFPIHLPRTILDIPLPETPKDWDENTIGTALGYVCLVIQLLSATLDIPVRHKMILRGSHSSIRDVLTASGSRDSE